MRYAIEDTTLTALGDAVRKHVGETREEIIPVEDNYYKFEIDTNNPDDWAKFTPRNPEHLEGEWTYQFNYIFRNAYNYKVVYNNATNDTYNTILKYAYAYISVYNPEIESTNGAYMIKFDREENLGSGVFITEHNDRYPGLQIYCCRKNSDEVRLNVSLEIYALDENGNVINEETITIKNTMTPMQMAEKINGLDSVPDEAFNITGNCQYRFGLGGWDWFINEYESKITTSDISNGLYMFYYTQLENIPFEINFNKSSTSHSIQYMFCNAQLLKEIPKMNNAKLDTMANIFNNCWSIRYLPEDIGDWFDWSYMEQQTSGYGCSKANMFSNCYSLRKVPMNLLNKANPNSTYSNSQFYSGFYNCYSLDEVMELPIPYTAKWTSNAFSNTFSKCRRLKEATFALQDDGTPYKVNWKNQVIDLADEVGYVGYSYGKPMSEWPETTIKLASKPIIDYNSGITADKIIYNEETYGALKDDPDAFCVANIGTLHPDYGYSRYNHNSAVNTINSLPDTTSSGGTNTIKFRGAAGALTDGGAISNLTEEEIAVAAAKGWTVSLV